MSRKDDERLKNFLICKIYATDEELDKMGPAIVIFLAGSIIALIAFVWFYG